MMQGSKVLLECYYTSPAKTYYENMLELFVDVIILVHCETHNVENTYVYDDKRTQSKLFYRTRMFDSDNNPLLSLTQDADTCISNLIHRTS